MGFEFSLILGNHFGVGFAGRLPYLRWVITLPIPEYLISLSYKLDRVPKPIKLRQEEGYLIGGGYKFKIIEPSGGAYFYNHKSLGFNLRTYFKGDQSDAICVESAPEDVLFEI